MALRRRSRFLIRYSLRFRRLLGHRGYVLNVPAFSVLRHCSVVVVAICPTFLLCHESVNVSLHAFYKFLTTAIFLSVIFRTLSPGIENQVAREVAVVLSAMEQAAVNDSSDEDLVIQILQGEPLLFEVIMRRHSQRLYRVARGILRDRWEAEDVMQAAYVRAYQHLSQFAGRAKFSTWLTRIAVHEALNRVEERSRLRYIEEMSGPESPASDLVRSQDPTPEQCACSSEHARVLAKAVQALPPKYRVVVMMRDLEEMSVAETAACLDITEENVKVRLHRARAMLRHAVYARVSGKRHFTRPLSPTTSPFSPPKSLHCRVGSEGSGAAR